MATLTPRQVAEAWIQAGGGADKETVAEAVAYSWIESGYSTTAVSPTGCVGLWQICPAPANATDATVNARAAVAKWKGCKGGSFACDWTPYDFGVANPGWAKGYADGLAAAAAIGTGAAPPPAQANAGAFGIGAFGSTVASGIQGAERDATNGALGLAIAALGVVVLAAAVWLMIKDTGTGRVIAGAVGGTARAGALAVFHV